MAAIVETRPYSGFVDMWVEVAPSVEKNFPQPFSGQVSAEWWSMGVNYMQMEDGRIYTRPDVCDPTLPYGWRKA